MQGKLKQLSRQALGWRTSRIIGIEYVPFMSVDLRERFAFPFLCGFCYMEVQLLPTGISNVIPNNFLPKQDGPFFLDFSSSSTQLQ